MQDKDALDTFSGAFVFVYSEHEPILWQRTSAKQSCKQTEYPFSLAHDTLPYISMQTDHDLINLIMT